MNNARVIYVRANKLPLKPLPLTFLLILNTQLLMLGVCACDWCSTVNTWPYFFERCCSGQKDGKV